ncbi:MAG: hypothetical protein AW07_04404 [Candidatus Accumulibacter sp. SK-11]|nr:MAG: hypothetical protein AW07_04404 [Candidatus Accumulibacter sp. SK-11]
MYLIRLPTPMKPSSSWITPATRPSAVSMRTMNTGSTSCRTSSMANAESTAAAGAQGAVIRRLVPPRPGATRPSAVAPRIPASAPRPA